MKHLHVSSWAMPTILILMASSSSRTFCCCSVVADAQGPVVASHDEKEEGGTTTTTRRHVRSRAAAAAAAALDGSSGQVRRTVTQSELDEFDHGIHYDDANVQEGGARSTAATAAAAVPIVEHEVDVSSVHTTVGTIKLGRGPAIVEEAEEAVATATRPYYDPDLYGDEGKHWITEASPVAGSTAGAGAADGPMMMVKAVDEDEKEEEDMKGYDYDDYMNSEVVVSAAVMPDDWDHTTESPTASPPPDGNDSDNDGTTVTATVEKTMAAFPCDTLVGSDCTQCLSHPGCVWTPAGCSDQCLMDTWCHHAPGDKDGVRDICGRVDKAQRDATDCAGRTQGGCNGCLSGNGVGEEGGEDRASCIWYEDMQSCASTCELYIGCGFEIVQVMECPVAAVTAAAAAAEGSAGEGRVVDPEVAGHAESLLVEEDGECKTEACFLASDAFMSAYDICSQNEQCIEEAFLCWQNPSLCSKGTSLDVPTTPTTLTKTASNTAGEGAATTKKIAKRRRRKGKLKRHRARRRKKNKMKTRKKKMHWSKRRWKMQESLPTDIKLRVDNDVVMDLEFDLQNLGLADAGSAIPVEMKQGSVDTSSLQSRSAGPAGLDTAYVLDHHVDGTVTVKTINGARSHSFHKDIPAVPSPRSQDQYIPSPRSQGQDHLVDADRCKAAAKTVMEHDRVILEMKALLTSESKKILEKEPCKSNRQDSKCEAVLAEVEATVASSIEKEKKLLEAMTQEKGKFCSHEI